MQNSQELNRPTIKKHRQQLFWQIILPIILISLLVFLGGGYLVIKGGSQTRIWSDVSIIWLIFPLFGILLLSLVILIGLIVLTMKINQKTPIVTGRVHQILENIRNSALKMSNSAVRPLFWIQQTQSGLSRIFKITRRSK